MIAATVVVAAVVLGFLAAAAVAAYRGDRDTAGAWIIVAATVSALLLLVQALV